jgi:glycerol-3-phosphate dehydrogenase subunit C
MQDPEKLARRVVDLCADCETCRDLMADEPCRFFPRLFQLHDRERAERRTIASAELRGLLDLCNMCGLCTCPDVRAGIMEAKGAFVARDGLRPALRLLEDVERVARIGGAAPRIANLLLRRGPASALPRRLLGIHPDRALPAFPPEPFSAWAARRGLHRKPPGTARKVAYFTGCTAQYLFPGVARAAVEVLERNGVSVFVPEQKCCGMPSMLEGDRPFTFALVEWNLRRLREAVEDGFDVVCSCPTCGYMLKKVLLDGAFFSQEYQGAFRRALSEARAAPGQVPDGMAPACLGIGADATAPSPRCRPPEGLAHVASGALRDEGYFRSLSGLDRIALASHTYDLGEYLQDLDRRGELRRPANLSLERASYFAPCHLKEQNIGAPWFDLLRLAPGASLRKVGGALDCCGMGGIMGLKREFHESSLAMGERLMQAIRATSPERLVTDCLSCRIQFQQALPYRVLHPVEVLAEAYATRDGSA